MNDEEWRDVTEAPEYQVSSLGRVRRSTPDARNHRLRTLKPYPNNKGYSVVTLATDGEHKRRLVHRLVCTAFNGPPPTLQHDAAHNDGSYLNNTADNLRWATREENMADCVLHGTRATGIRHGRSTKPHRTPRGERHGHAKLTAEDVLSIRERPTPVGSGRALAVEFGVSPATICIIRSGKTWSHLGVVQHG